MSTVQGPAMSMGAACVWVSNFERIYVPNPFVKNGFHSLMALGTVAAWVYVSGDTILADYLQQELITERQLHVLARDHMLVDFGRKSNFSVYNMAFMGAWLATRYLQDAAARDVIRETLRDELYDKRGSLLQPQPVAWRQSLFDFI